MSLRKIVDKIAERGGVREYDFTDSVTESTSAGFDRWARKRLKDIMKDADVEEVYAALQNRPLLYIEMDE